jgi:hypothetical protein
VVATREALETAETWGEVREVISAARYAELVDEHIAPAEQPPDDDEPFEAPERWPFLRYNDMPGWLPSAALDLGDGYSSMLDSGINFLAEDSERLGEALEAAGVTICTGGPSLEDLFEPM